MRAFEKLFCGRGFQSKPFSKVFPLSLPPPYWDRLPNRSAPYGSRFVSLQIVQQRMKSVGNIQKITAAMKMVAASRLKGAQVKMEKSRGLVMPLIRLLGDLPGAH